MANEVKMSAALSFDNQLTALSIDVADTAVSLDVTGSKYVHAVQNVGTSEEALGMGDITSPGYAYFKNRDATNFVSIRPATGVADMIKLKAGESCVFRLVATAPFVIADTAACDLEYAIVED